jgi:hypothetical protein
MHDAAPRARSVARRARRSAWRHAPRHASAGGTRARSAARRGTQQQHTPSGSPRRQRGAQLRGGDATAACAAHNAPSAPPSSCHTPRRCYCKAPPLARPGWPCRLACSLVGTPQTATRRARSEKGTVLRRAASIASTRRPGRRRRRRTHDVLVYLLRDAAFPAIQAVVQVCGAARARGRSAACCAAAVRGAPRAAATRARNTRRRSSHRI